MTNNAIPRKLCEVVETAILEADVWREEQHDQGRLVGTVAFAADVVDRLNGHGYSLIPTVELHALWTENEHIKNRLLRVAGELDDLAARNELLRADLDAAVEARDMALDLMETGGDECEHRGPTTPVGACRQCGENLLPADEPEHLHVNETMHDADGAVLGRRCVVCGELVAVCDPDEPPIETVELPPFRGEPSPFYQDGTR